MEALLKPQALTFERIKFVPARDPTSHSVAVPAGLVPLNKPMKVSRQPVCHSSSAVLFSLPCA